MGDHECLRVEDFLRIKDDRIFHCFIQNGVCSMCQKPIPEHKRLLNLEVIDTMWAVISEMMLGVQETAAPPEVPILDGLTPGTGLDLDRLDLDRLDLDQMVRIIRTMAAAAVDQTGVAREPKRQCKRKSSNQ